MAGGVVKIGPWGYDEGPRWDYQFNGCKLTNITVVVDTKCICSIQFTCLVDNNEIPSPPFGDNNPDDATIHTVIIADGEKLTEISGTVFPLLYDAQYGKKFIITSLGFKVGTKTYGPYGTPEGDPFSLPVDSGDVSGFFGYCGHGKFLDSLGVIISPINRQVVVGPWGGNGGDPWEFLLNGRKLTKITLLVSWTNNICSIHFTCLVDNEEVPSPPFGDNNPDDATAYTVDIPIPDGEKLTGMSGTVGPYPPQSDNLVITSLSFQVGTESYGPYPPQSGPTNGTPFSLPVDSGDFSGFFGRREPYVLNSLGGMLSPIN